MDRFQPPAQPIPVTEPFGKATYQWWEWFRRIGGLFDNSVSTTITLAALTGGGTQGSITVVNGVITNYVAPT